MKTFAAALCRLTFLSMCCASTARAEPDASSPPPEANARSRVVLVRPAADNTELAEAPTRIVAELEAAGFEVEVVDGDPALDPREQLARIESRTAPGATPVATIMLASAGTSADIWVADRVTAKTTVRRIDIAQTAQAASILAVRTVELLRASLLETRTADPVSEPRTAPAAGSDDEREGALPTYSEDPASGVVAALDLGLVGLFGLNGIRPHLGPSLRVAVGTLAIKGRLTLAAPLLGERLDQSQGAATVQPLLGQLDVVASFPVQNDARLYGSLGFGGYLMRVRGEAIAPAIAHEQTVLGAALQMGMGLQLQAAPQLALFIEPQLIWLLPEVVVRIADREAGRIGQPAISSTIGVTWTF
jgi:hypothetical protein